MNQWTDVQNLLDLVDHVWIGLVLIAVAAVPSFFAARNHSEIKKVSKDTARLDRSISNGHSYPLRQDVDEIRQTLDGIRSDLKEVKSDVTDIRSELREERKDRLDLDNRFERYRRNG
jgi:septal ring factor EnvC (AmiA/AmiB activator)